MLWLVWVLEQLINFHFILLMQFLPVFLPPVLFLAKLGQVHQLAERLAPRSLLAPLAQCQVSKLQEGGSTLNIWRQLASGG